jgi:hypothetical protein
VEPWRHRSRSLSCARIIRDVLSKEFGDLDKDADFLVSISPIGDVDKIRAPLPAVDHLGESGGP